MQYQFHTTPMEHQKNALLKGWSHQGFAYLMGTGTGKTKTTIDNAGILYELGKISGILILANKGSYTNWIPELETHLPPRIARRIYVWDGSNSQRNRLQYQSLLGYDGLAIVLMNIEALSNNKARAYDLAQNFLGTGDRMMVVDESTTIKNISAMRTKNTLELGKLAKFRRILTGTPVTQSPLNIFSQFEFLDSRLLGYKSYYAFRARYAVMQKVDFGGRTIQVPVGYRNLEELKDKIAPHSFRVIKEDCLDLPPKIFQTYFTEMSDEQAKIYGNVRDFAVAELATETYVTATEVISRILRLHQIVCGYAVDELGEIHDLSDRRIHSLLEVIEEMEGQTIIWANYRHNISKIKEALAKEYGEDSVITYYGDTSQNDRDLGREKFQDGRVRFFVSNPQTGGYGLTLTAASNVIYYSNNYSLEKRIQSEDRAHRIGQKKSVTYVDLVCKDTVDEKILASLRKNMDMSRIITGDTWREWI